MSNDRTVLDDGFVPALVDVRAREEIHERGLKRRHLPVDVDIARALGELAHSAWLLPRDQYYEGGARFRTLNRLRARIAEGGVEFLSCDDLTPYVQQKKYNTSLGDQPR